MADGDMTEVIIQPPDWEDSLGKRDLTIISNEESIFLRPDSNIAGRVSVGFSFAFPHEEAMEVDLYHYPNFDKSNPSAGWRNFVFEMIDKLKEGTSPRELLTLLGRPSDEVLEQQEREWLERQALDE